jgi:hypothetical protein
MAEATGKNSPTSSVDGNTDDNQGPLESNLREIAFSPLTAGGVGVAGLLATDRLGMFGSGSKTEQALHAANLMKKLKIPSQSDFILTPASELNAKIEAAAAGAASLRMKDIDIQAAAAGAAAEAKLAGSGTAAEAATRSTLTGALSAESAGSSLGAELNKIRRAAGMAGGDTLLHRIGSTVTRRGLSTFGQSTSRRARRGAVGLVAAALPALAGTLLTPDHAQDNA